jgi:hypothetical protein
MRKIAFVGIVTVLAIAVLAGCNTGKDQWYGSTGSPANGPQPAAYHPSGAAANGQLRGCLSGATDSFTLVEENSATVYRLLTPEDPEARPNAREIVEDLRLNNARMVAISGEPRREDTAPGVPEIVVRSVSPVAESCPAALQGAVNELNRPPVTSLNLTHAGSVGTTRGSMRMTRPPVSIMPVNPAH